MFHDWLYWSESLPMLQIADCFEGSSARSEILHCCEEVERADLHQVAAYLSKLELR